MTRTIEHMLQNPYVEAVLGHLKNEAHVNDEQAKKLLIRHYKPIKRFMGFNPDASYFANEILEMERWATRKFSPGEPTVHVGHLIKQLRDVQKKNKQRVIVKVELAPKSTKRIKQPMKLTR